MATLLYSTFQFHGGSTNKPSVVSLHHTQRLLLLEKDSSPDNVLMDDDYTRDETCRQYLVNFLNGTTDAKDECQGFYNAWKAADCRDDSHLSDFDIAWYYFLDLLGLGRRHRAENGTVVDDDVVMDDSFEQWQCCSSITDFYQKHCQPTDFDAFKLFAIITVLVICGFTKSLIRVTGLRTMTMDS